jgi:hypothetical protein
LLTVNRGKPSEREIALDSVQGRTYKQRDLPPPTPQLGQPPISTPRNGQSRGPGAAASRSPPKPSSEEEPTGDGDSSTVRGHWKARKGEVILAGVAGLVAAALVAAAGFAAMRLLHSPTTPTQPAAPGKISTPNALKKYVLTRTAWSGEPAIFAAMLKIAVSDQASPGHPPRVRLNATGTDVATQSVSNLAQNGARLHGGPMMIVGRVRESTASPVVWDPQGQEAEGPDTDAELESPDKKMVVFGLIEGSLSKGQVVYFPGVVVAVGHTKGSAGTAYVVSLSTAISRVPTSGAIRVRFDAYQPSRFPGGALVAPG